jgi:hypothetical protein
MHIHVQACDIELLAVKLPLGHVTKLIIGAAVNLFRRPPLPPPHAHFEPCV